ncbi:hypothetical protein J6590_075002 [Homalodisca vitripennis]|nr:hypothetical protein J6590_075002 [Homalodisca vitripennis]
MNYSNNVQCAVIGSASHIIAKGIIGPVYQHYNVSQQTQGCNDLILYSLEGLVQYRRTLSRSCPLERRMVPDTLPGRPQHSVGVIVQESNRSKAYQGGELLWGICLEFKTSGKDYYVLIMKIVLRVNKNSLTLNLGVKTVTSETPLMAGQTGCLQGQNRSAVTHPCSSHARRYWIRLSCDIHRTLYTAPLARDFVLLIKRIGSQLLDY